MYLLGGLVDSIVDLFSDLILYSSIRLEAAYLVGLLTIAILGGLTWFFSRRLRGGQLPILRGLPGVYDIRRNIENAAESGKTVHFSIGTGGLGDALSVQTLAGLDNLREISLQSSLLGPPLISTTSSPLALPAMESTVRGAYSEASAGAGYEAENDRFVAPTPIAYASGVMRVLNSEKVGFNVMVGSFGDEYLLIGETGAARNAKQLVASADPSVLPFAIATADYPIIGEELFALSSYLRPLPSRLASLISQDILRLALVVLVLALVVAVSVNPELQALFSGWASSPGSQSGSILP